ncbi:MAG: DUF1801 domain-containing protein [Microbacterium sp.]
MEKTGGSVAAFIAEVTPEKRRRDAATMVAMMREITGREPELWGTIVGFGSCHYRYPTGTEGDVPIAAFAPRKQATTVYLLDAGAHDFADLGPHTTGAGCLYLKDLEAVDTGILRDAIATDYRRVLDGDTGYAAYTVTD